MENGESAGHRHLSFQYHAFYSFEDEVTVFVIIIIIIIPLIFLKSIENAVDDDDFVGLRSL